MTFHNSTRAIHPGRGISALPAVGGLRGYSPALERENA